MMVRRRRAPAVFAAVLAALVVLSACAAIPSSGRVTQAADDGGLGESTVRYSPAGPATGASPEQVVRGYLDAMLAYPASSRTARAFLSPAAAKQWNPSSGVRIYTSPEVVGPATSARARERQRTDSGSPVVARVGFVEDARLDRQGRYRRTAAPSSVTYSLEQVDGQWRISNPQPGLMVNRKFFTDYYRSFNLYFFDRPGRRLVPDRVHLVAGDQLATSLITGLASGIRPADQPAARTYVPPLDVLRPSVPVSADGVADVEFTDDFGAMGESARDHLSAQLVWTLRQVPEIEQVQVVGGDTPLFDGQDALQPVTSWAGYGPSVAMGQAYAIGDGKIMSIDGELLRPVSGAWGRDARGFDAAAVSDAGVAAVRAGREEVRLTTRQGTRARIIPGAAFVTPWWDVDGTLWLVDRGRGGTRVRVVTGKTQRAIPIGRLARRQVESFSLSPDGTRYAVVTTGPGGGAVRVGLVLRDAKDRIQGLGDPQAIPASADAPRSVGWTSSTEVTFLTDTDAGVQVAHAAIDGSVTTDGVTRSGTRLPDVGADVLAIGKGDDTDLYALDARGRLWLRAQGTSWRLVKTSMRFTGLSYGR
ncbi:MAG: hypothetical protein JWP31_867 [Aeromicrobium sp.]|nr:hypothetical protein [Aeromicrobium sp.]